MCAEGDLDPDSGVAANDRDAARFSSGQAHGLGIRACGTAAATGLLSRNPAVDGHRASIQDWPGASVTGSEPGNRCEQACICRARLAVFDLARRRDICPGPLRYGNPAHLGYHTSGATHVHCGHERSCRSAGSRTWRDARSLARAAACDPVTERGRRMAARAS